MIAADYWEECGDDEIADWLRLWAEVAPDEMEAAPRRRGATAPCAWGKDTKFAKRLRSRQERQAARSNPLTENAYGHRGIW